MLFLVPFLIAFRFAMRERSVLRVGLIVMSLALGYVIDTLTLRLSEAGGWHGLRGWSEKE